MSVQKIELFPGVIQQNPAKFSRSMKIIMINSNILFSLPKNNNLVENAEFFVYLHEF